MVYGVYIVPLVPIVIFEARSSQSKLRSSLVSSLTWLISIISYYVYMGFQLAFLGVSTRPELHISSQKDPFFWENLGSVIWHDIFLSGIVEWGGIAVVGGFIIGFLISFLYLNLVKLIVNKSFGNKSL